MSSPCRHKSSSADTASIEPHPARDGRAIVSLVLKYPDDEVAGYWMYRRGVGAAETIKRTPTIPVPRRLLVHMKRWRKDGGWYFVHVNGRSDRDIMAAWKRALVTSGIEHCRPHDLHNTAVTWAMQGGSTMNEATEFFGMSPEILKHIYGHHHPGYPASVPNALGLKS